MPPFAPDNESVPVFQSVLIHETLALSAQRPAGVSNADWQYGSQQSSCSAFTQNRRGQRQGGQSSSSPQQGFGSNAGTRGRARGRGRGFALGGRLGRPQGGSPQRRRNQNTSSTRPKPAGRSNIRNRLGARVGGGGGGGNSVANRRAKLALLRARRIAATGNRNASSTVNPVSIRAKENAILSLIDRATRLQRQIDRQRDARNKAIAMKRAFCKSDLLFNMHLHWFR